MHRIGVIGDKDSILGFKALGIEVFSVEDAEEAEKTLENMVVNNFAVIYITEQTAKDITPVIDRYNSRTVPVIIPIPGNQGTLGLGMQGVKRTVERAVGADILFKGEQVN
ncbi:V/A-type H+-transporting ATPase subunit F [Anaerobacterium chartisolvens]|uniref:V/A-type H+-transporting ATPase subunit F n=1 Tax=Anaerobacterium chartisolvens TaxID=1297424 RepID=A0A369B7I0_9FIRM|nr:V-type ATP synthase subunit F [Anaerobacterium chartisolvens]RCX17482.1 V/A-type H+-transporting ATPase subunit F [Anaerobacterium chartisolvens]